MTGFSYQLYGSRNSGPLEGTLRMLAEAGYGAVEGYGGVYGDPAGLARALRAAGLAMPTGHFAPDMLERDPHGVLAIAGAVGMERVYAPWIAPGDRPASRAGWMALGARLDAMGRPFRDAGLGFGWHNHDFEFAPLPCGTPPMEALLEGGPDLEWEIDVAWVIRGGADPLDWIARHGARITAVHVKDIAAPGAGAGEDGWADLGQGTVAWRPIMAALRSATPARHFVLEHDSPSDDARFARVSLAAARAL